MRPNLGLAKVENMRPWMRSLNGLVVDGRPVPGLSTSSGVSFPAADLDFDAGRVEEGVVDHLKKRCKDLSEHPPGPK